MLPSTGCMCSPICPMLTKLVIFLETLTGQCPLMSAIESQLLANSLLSTLSLRFTSKTTTLCWVFIASSGIQSLHVVLSCFLVRIQSIWLWLFQLINIRWKSLLNSKYHNHFSHTITIFTCTWSKTSLIYLHYHLNLP